MFFSGYKEHGGIATNKGKTAVLAEFTSLVKNSSPTARILITTRFQMKTLSIVFSRQFSYDSLEALIDLV